MKYRDGLENRDFRVGLHFYHVLYGDRAAGADGSAKRFVFNGERGLFA